LKKIFLFFATFFEAKPFIYNYNFTKKDKNFFVFKNFSVIITGIGKINVLKTLEKFKECIRDEVWIIGLSYSFDETKLLNIIEPQLVLEESMLQNYNINNLKFPLLITVDKPIASNDDFKKRFSLLKDFYSDILVDMESYWIIDFIRRNNIFSSLRVLRIISDNGEADFKSSFKERKEKLQNILFDVAKFILKS